MEQFFYPRQIGVVGASDDPGNLGKLIIQNLISFGFTGQWHAIGHTPGKVFDQPIYRSILDVPAEIDLAIILTRPEYVPGIAEECGQKGIKRLAISTAGFSEYSEEGVVLEKQLLETCKRYDIRFIGPNCLAVMNMENGLCLPFSIQNPIYWEKGPVGVISQSGTVALHYSKHLSYGKVGVGKVASIGNKLDVNEVDLLEYFLRDPQTEVIFIYLESFSRPRALLELAATGTKPIILQKSNISSLSQGVARSHTNAITGDDAVTEFALKEAGIIRVRDIYEAMNCVKAALLPPLKGNRLAVISPGGGTAVMGADEAHRSGFDLPTLPQPFFEWLESKGRAGIISLTNPMDLGDIYNMDVYVPAMEKILSLPEIDGIFLDIGYASEWAELISYTKLFEYCSRINDYSDKPVFLRANVAHPEALKEINESISAPYFESMPGAFNAIRKVMDARKITPVKPATRKKPGTYDEIEKIIKDARHGGKTFLDYEGYDILKVMEIPTAKYDYLPRERADDISGLRLSFPVALKALGEDLFHKTESGGVCLDLKNLRELSDELAEMRSKNGLLSARGFLIQRMIEDGIEMIVGGRRDPQFGPVVMVGMGGVMVELLSDISAAPAPVDMEMAERMIKALKGYPLLSGFRGSAPADVASICEIVKNVSCLMAGFPAVEEIDLNPVKVFDQGKGSVVVDCKVFLRAGLLTKNK
jgi:acyl-CoA synthetase (NDP forming)